jgi:hypothetical protein
MRNFGQLFTADVEFHCELKQTMEAFLVLLNQSIALEKPSHGLED